MFGYYVQQPSLWHDVNRTLRWPINYCIYLWRRLCVTSRDGCRSWVYEHRRSKIGSSENIVGECKYRVMGPKDVDAIAISVDPAQISLRAVWSLGVHCLPRPIRPKTLDHHGYQIQLLSLNVAETFCFLHKRTVSLIKWYFVFLLYFPEKTKIDMVVE